MPHFNVHMFEEALDGAVEPATIRALTDALVSVYGERARSSPSSRSSGSPAAAGASGAPRRSSTARPSRCTCVSRRCTWSTMPPTG